jgi:hypothetical protein
MLCALTCLPVHVSILFYSAIDVDASGQSSACTCSWLQVLCADFFHLAPTLIAHAIFVSPPWGGPNYKWWVIKLRDYCVSEGVS